MCPWGQSENISEILICKRLALILTLIFCKFSAVSAFVAPGATHTATSLSATDSRREFVSGAATAAAAAIFAGVPAANAIRDYENIGYLGGGDKVDVNNANVRVYLKFPGMYPAVAGKIASGGPYSSVGDLYKIKGLTSREAEVIKKYESSFLAKPPSADYVIDRINNGLYR